ncbi:recombination-associated protein RdgC [Rheinheimera sp.]|uniref:recombination-associated protein RdgC n=1 Tax=Rheinheimera sp. TaxID=1869214 RepID=UPI0027B908BC|nr:recombination-associated protein RdgC [Rheinheimera sp.]
MWFKNLRVYQITEALNLEPEALERALQEHKFSPCTGQEAVKMGFTYPLHHSIKQYHHQQAHLHLFAVKRQEKVLPAAVINEELQPKIDALEAEKGRPLGRKEKNALKEELVQMLLPRAFSRSSVTTALYDAQNQWFIVNSSSAGRAEEVLSLLRKTLGSLPALPWIDQNQLNLAMQQWLTNTGLPQGFVLGNEAELKAPDEEGAKVKFSNHLLTAAEVQSHLEDKLVTKLELALENQISLMVCEDGSLKKLRFHEMLANSNDELGWDDMVLRLDADLLVMANELATVLKAIRQSVSAE